MAAMDIPAAKDITTAFLGNRERLGRLAARKLNPLLSSLVSTDDILQETFMASQRRQRICSPATQTILASHLLYTSYGRRILTTRC